jgi:hypothetical protein
MLAQVFVSPSGTPTINTGGWVYGMAVLLVVLGVLVTFLIVFGYMRFAPRFQREEGRTRSIKAPRLEPGKEVRRPVKITGAPVMAPAPISTATVAAPAAAAPAPAATEHGGEVTLDQETYEKTLAELLGKGTDRRVAEGQAKRVALIAARKKAGG